MDDEQQSAARSLLGAAYQWPNDAVDNRVIVHDACQGPNGFVAASGTRPCYPGPGVMTAFSVTTGSFARYENGRLLISHNPAGGFNNYVHWGPQTCAAGLTMIARFKPAYLPGRPAQTVVGWTHNGNDGFRRGVLVFSFAVGDNGTPTIWMSKLDSPTSNTVVYYRQWAYKPGTEVAVAIRYVSTSHVEFWMQSETVAGLGCVVGSNEWFKIGETRGGSFSGTVYPTIGHQLERATEVYDVKVLSNWSPSNSHQCFDFTRATKGVHVPAIAKDQNTGLVTLAWNQGSGHETDDQKIRGSVKLASGVWTDPVVLVPTPTSPARVHIGTLANVGSAFWLTYINKPDGTNASGILTVVELYINPSDGSITTSVPFVPSGWEGVVGLTPLNSFITLANGTILAPYHDTNGYPWVGRSMNNGASWTHVQMVSSFPAGTTWLVEGCLVEESDGAVGAYHRSRGTSPMPTYYQRSTNGGATWSTPVAIPGLIQTQDTGNDLRGARQTIAKSEDGTIWLAGNDDSSKRRRITIYQMGDNGKLIKKHLLVDMWGPGSNPANGEQYPAIMFHEQKLILAYSFESQSGSIGNPDEAVTAIQLHELPWPAGVIPKLAGGTSIRTAPNINNGAPREVPPGMVTLASNTVSPQLDSAHGTNALLVLNTGASPGAGGAVTMQVPLAPIHGARYTIIIEQGGAGSNVMSWVSGFDHAGLDSTLPTAVGSCKVFEFIYNQRIQKFIRVV